MLNITDLGLDSGGADPHRGPDSQRVQHHQHQRGQIVRGNIIQSTYTGMSKLRFSLRAALSKEKTMLHCIKMNDLSRLTLVLRGGGELILSTFSLKLFSQPKLGVLRGV